MADQKQVKRLLKSVKTWNMWRKQYPAIEPDLSGADLSGADLHDTCFSFALLGGAMLANADLSGANFSKAMLGGAMLRGANLSGANFSKAILTEADLGFTDLNNTNLSNTDLTFADLIYSKLISTNFDGARIAHTSFGDHNLRLVKGLETTIHLGPSPLSINTLYLSEGDVPEKFLRGTGAQDTLIEYAKSLASHPIEYYTCFISYSSKDHAFAERLYNDLQGKGVCCWYAPKHLKWGTRIDTGIDEAIRLHEKLLLILSKHSLESGWVEREVKTALAKEKKERSTVLFPFAWIMLFLNVLFPGQPKSDTTSIWETLPTGKTTTPTNKTCSDFCVISNRNDSRFLMQHLLSDRIESCIVVLVGASYVFQE